MCGIVGGLGPACNKNQILLGQKQLAHRGMDESIFSKCGLTGFWAMNRLSIQDSQTKLYPFHFRHYSLIFNGEIYNVEELAKLLEKSGIKLKTHCDAEIILPLFDLFGVQAFEKIDGMFAISIYDEQKNCFYLARDIFGEKPLYYFQNGKACYFASELQALPKLVRQLSPSAIPEFLTFGYLNLNRTFYQDVYKVLPGECVSISPTKIKKTIFAEVSHYLDKSILNQSSSQQIETLDNNLRKIVTKKIAGDAKIGIFLSGGLDSSLLTALTQAEQLRQKSEPIYTYSIGFNSQNDDESDNALAVAHQLQTRHTQLQFDQHEIHRAWERLISTGDEPITDPAIIPTLLLADRAKQDVKVILTGEGADEIFGGYSRYRKFHQAHAFHSDFLANQVKGWPASSLNIYKVFSDVGGCYAPVTYLSLWLSHGSNREQYLSLIKLIWQETDLVESAFSGLSIPQNLQLYDLKHYVPEQLCMKVDKVLMQDTIESRAPYLDKTLLPFLLTDSQSTPKFLLKEVAGKYLDQKIINQPKHGFTLPLRQILKGSLSNEVAKLESAHSELVKVIPQLEISQLLHSFENGNSSIKNTIWNLMTVNSWLLQHQ